MGTPTGATLGANTSYTHTITNDDAPTISFATTTGAANEGNSGTQTVNVTANLSSAATTAVTVPITYSGTATSGTDYSATTNLISIAAGATTGTASFSVIGDTTIESNETVILTMGNPVGTTGTTLTSSSATVVSNLTSLPTGSGARTYNAWIQLEPGDNGTIISQGTINPSTFYHRSAFIVSSDKLILDFQVKLSYHQNFLLTVKYFLKKYNHSNAKLFLDQN
jgi:hypothetical protein